jgi:DNA replication and repair protein RecF
MIIKSLFLSNFRNFGELNLNFSERVNIFVGDNGHGKTNILEALYLLIEGESFRYSKTETLIQIQKSQSLIRSQIENQTLDYFLKLQISGSKKDLSVNEKKISQAKLNLPPAVLFSPESLSIIKESSEERRSLIDQLVTQTHRHGRQVLADFRLALKTRNKILKDMAQERIERNLGLETLLSVNPSFLRLAAEVTMLRITALAEIKDQVQSSLRQIHQENNVTFDYEYVMSDKNHKNSDLQTVVSALQNRMKELQSAEIQSGGSLVGPQKHDVTFLYNGNDSRFFCSQGQQRSIILAFKMAQIVYHHRVHGFYPVLLLDDVLSELDLRKQESLISTLNQTETQTFVTTTDVSLISKLSMRNSRVFTIKNGQVIA